MIADPSSLRRAGSLTSATSLQTEVASSSSEAGNVWKISHELGPRFSCEWTITEECNVANNFHAAKQVRVIVERLVRRLDYETVAEHIPEADRKLLTHIRKEQQRKQRKGGQSEEGSQVPTSSTPAIPSITFAERV